MDRGRADQDRGRSDTDRRIGDLLQDLRHGSLHHGLVGLKIASPRTQNAEQKDCRREDPQDRDRIVFYQDSRPEIQEQASGCSYDE